MQSNICSLSRYKQTILNIRKQIFNKKENTFKGLLFNSIRIGANVLFPIIFIPYITRVLGLKYVGIFNWGGSIVSILMVASAMGLPTIAVREISLFRDKKNKVEEITENIFSINLFITLIFVAVVIGLMFFSTFDLIYKQTIYILLFMAIAQTIGVDWLFVGLRNQYVITIRNVIGKLLLIISVFIFVSSPNDYIFFLYIYIFTFSLPLVWNFLSTFNKISVAKLEIKLFKKHIDREVFKTLLLTLLLSYFGKIDIIIAGFFMDSNDLGIFSSVYRLVSVALVFLSSWALVLLPKAALMREEDAHFLHFVDKIINICLVLGGLFSLLLSLFSKEIIIILFGEAFLPGETQLSILAYIIPLLSIYNFIAYQCFYLKKNYSFLMKGYLIITIVGGFSSVILYNWRDEVTDIVTIIIGTNILLLIYTLALLKRSELSFLLTKNKVKILLAIFLSVLFFNLIFDSDDSTSIDYLQFVLKGTFVVLLYMLLLFLTKEDVFKMLMSKVNYKIKIKK